jgi:heptosyltransferase II
VIEIEALRIRSIMIRGTNWVGDAVISIPAMRALRGIFPGARITLLVRPWVRDVYSRVDFLDEIREFDKGGVHRGLRGFLRLAAELRGRGYDAAFLFQNAFEAALLARLARIPIRAGYCTDLRRALLTHPLEVNPAVRREHQAYYYLDILSGLRLLPSRLWLDKSCRLDAAIGVRPEDLQAAHRMLGEHGLSGEARIVGVNPGAAYGPAKRWASERFAAVADILSSRFRSRIVIFGSAAEREIAQEMASGMRSKPVIFAGRTTLGQLMALISRCALLITNDSGPMHLAAALGVPQVAIFGSTSEVATGPISNLARIVRNPVDCSPCFLRECPIDFRCMTGISVERVVGEAAELMQTRGRG